MAALYSVYANAPGSLQPGQPGYRQPVNEQWHPAADFLNSPAGQAHQARDNQLRLSSMFKTMDYPGRVRAGPMAGATTSASPSNYWAAGNTSDSNPNPGFQTGYANSGDNTMTGYMGPQYTPEQQQMMDKYWALKNTGKMTPEQDKAMMTDFYKSAGQNSAWSPDYNVLGQGGYDLYGEQQALKATQEGRQAFGLDPLTTGGGFSNAAYGPAVAKGTSSITPPPSSLGEPLSNTGRVKPNMGISSVQSNTGTGDVGVNGQPQVRAQSLGNTTGDNTMYDVGGNTGITPNTTGDSIYDVGGNTGIQPNYFNYGGANTQNPWYNFASGLGNTVGTGGGSLADLFNNAGNQLNGQNIPLIGMAIKQWMDANTYGTNAEKAAGMADPFGGQRPQYMKMLSDVYTDPTGVLNNPSHQAVVNKQMNAIDSRNRASGYLGSGKSSMDLADYQAQADAQYLDQEKARLAQLSGSQFDPSRAAEIWSQGQTNKMNAQNGALGALGYLYQNMFGNKAGGTNPGGGGGGPIITNPNTNPTGGSIYNPITGEYQPHDPLTGNTENIAPWLLAAGATGYDVSKKGGGITPPAGNTDTTSQEQQGQPTVDWDANGNIINKATGKVVAIKGADGQYYNTDENLAGNPGDWPNAESDLTNFDSFFNKDGSFNEQSFFDWYNGGDNTDLGSFDPFSGP